MDWRTSTTTIRSGNAGNRQTLAAMSRLAQGGSIDPVVVQAAQDAVRPYPERNPDGDFAAVLADVRRRMRYTHDPLGAEVVKEPRYVIDRTNASRYPEPMDCDDASVLTAAMLGGIGYVTKFVTVAADKSRRGEWSHVYVAARHPETGRWVALDPIVRDFAAGDEVPESQLTAPRAYHEGAGQMIGRMGCGGGRFESMAGMGRLGTVPRDQAISDQWAPYYASQSPAAQSAAPDGDPWYSQVLTAADKIFSAKSKADIAASNAAIAQAQARAMTARNRAQVMPSGGFLRNADGSINAVNAALAIGGAAVIGYFVFKASSRR